MGGRIRPKLRMAIANNGDTLVIKVPVRLVQEFYGLSVEEKPMVGVLTPRQKRVLEEILSGKCDKEIAMGMNISASTVKYYSSEIYRRCRVNGRAGLLRHFAGRDNGKA